jgi:hypothetical protein
MSVGDLFSLAEGAIGADVVLSAHERPLILEAGCLACRGSTRIASLRGAIPPCPRCGGSLVPLVHRMRSGFRPGDVGDLLDATWRDLGLPPGGAVRASNGTEDEVVFLFNC